MTAYILEPGSSGNNVSAPHKSSLDFSSSQSVLVVACLALDDWTPAGAAQSFFSVFDSAADGMVRCTVNSTGTLTMTVNVGATSFNGSSSIGAAVTAGVADGSPMWLWYMWQSSDGTVDFKYSVDPPETAVGSVAWTALQTNRASSTSGTLDTSTAPIRIGGSGTSGGTIPMAGKLYRAQMYAGASTGATLASTLLVDCDPSQYSGAGSTFVSGGDTWTINGTASVVGAGSAPAPYWGIKNHS